MYAHIVVWVLLTIFYDVLSGLLELIGPLILYWGIHQNSYCQLLIYMIWNGIGVITKMIFLINFWSTIGFADSYSNFPIPMIVVTLWVWFYVTSIVVTYLAYKEFKAWAVPYAQYADQEGYQELLPMNRFNSGKDIFTNMF